MRRITLAAMSTLAALVLLLSYRTSSGAGGATAASVVSSARVVGNAPVAKSTSAGPDPRSTPTRSAGKKNPATASSSTPTTSADVPPDTTTQRSSTSKKHSRRPPASSSTASSSAPPTTAPAAAPVTVQGAGEMTRYGIVQVQVTITGSQIVDVSAVAYPNRDSRDREINDSAIPALQNQVLSAQSANVQGVSGATYTTEGFLASVQSALDAAGFKS